MSVVLDCLSNSVTQFHVRHQTYLFTDLHTFKHFKRKRKHQASLGLRKRNTQVYWVFVLSGTREHVSLQSEVIALPWVMGQRKRGWV